MSQLTNYTVTPDLIKELYRKSSKNRRAELEQLYPDLYPPLEERVKRAINELGYFFGTRIPELQFLEAEGEPKSLLVLDLPVANNEWVMSAYTWSIKFCGVTAPKHDLQAWMFHSKDLPASKLYILVKIEND